jgi:hypothetical protein
MDDKADKPKRRWLTYVAVVLVLALVLYPLSIGPMLVLNSRFQHDTSKRIFEAIYGPLISASRLIGAIEMIESYDTWWFEITNSVPQPPADRSI